MTECSGCRSNLQPIRSCFSQKSTPNSAPMGRLGSAVASIPLYDGVCPPQRRCKGMEGMEAIKRRNRHGLQHGKQELGHFLAWVPLWWLPSLAYVSYHPMNHSTVLTAHPQSCWALRGYLHSRHTVRSMQSQGKIRES